MAEAASIGRPQIAWRVLLVFAALKLVLHAATNWQYGFHRDELYYINGGMHLGWGYVDHPPLTPLLARLATAIFGLSVPGLRLFAALAGVGIVLLAGLLAREFGAERLGQALAALAVLLAPLYLVTNTMFQTVPFDQFWWLLIAYLLVRLINGGDARLWLLIGLVGGIALETKYTVALLGLGLAVGLVATPLRAQLWSRWFWLGLALAALIAAPNLAWQIQNGFPTLEFIRNNSADVRNDSSRLGLVAEMLILAGPPLLPLLTAGFVFFWSRAHRQYRVFGWASVVVLVVVIGGQAKAYYAGPLFALLFAGGAAQLEPWLLRRSAALRADIVGALTVLSLPVFVALLPILPPALFISSGVYQTNDEYTEMLGWPDLVDAVTATFERLPVNEQANTAILTGNYGEASAIELLAPRLPAPISGHNSHYYWSIGRTDAPTYIVLGYSAQRLRVWFDDVQQAGVISNRYRAPNEEFDQPFFICRRPKVQLSTIWPTIKHFN